MLLHSMSTFFHEKAVDKTYRVTNTFKMKHVLEHDFERRASFWTHVPPAIKQCISMTLTLLKVIDWSNAFTMFIRSNPRSFYSIAVPMSSKIL